MYFVNSGNQKAPRGDFSELHWTDLLLADIKLIPQYILEVADNYWECRCGNTPNSDGFEACNEFGLLVPSELGPWGGVLWACLRCWRIINGDTLEVLGFAEATVIDTNLEL